MLTINSTVHLPVRRRGPRTGTRRPFERTRRLRRARRGPRALVARGGGEERRRARGSPRTTPRRAPASSRRGTSRCPPRPSTDCRRRKCDRRKMMTMRRRRRRRRCAHFRFHVHAHVHVHFQMTMTMTMTIIGPSTLGFRPSTLSSPLCLPHAPPSRRACWCTRHSPRHAPPEQRTRGACRSVGTRHHRS